MACIIGEIMIRAEGVTKKYKTKSGEVVGVDQINFEIKKKGLYMILGKSGCGKTTLLNVLGGLDSYDFGHIYINGADMAQFTENELDTHRNIDIGIIFQEFNLIPELTVYDNLRLVLEIQEWKGKNEENIKNTIEENLKRVGLDGYSQRKVYQLSGGERQRVSIARVLIKNPAIIFADEPTGNLDAHTGMMIFELLKEISKEYVVIVVTHDKEFAKRYGDEIINIENGKISGIEKTETSFKYSFSLYNNSLKDKKHYKNIDFDKVCEILKSDVFSSKNSGDIVISEISCTEDKLENNVESEKTNIKPSQKQTKKLSLRYRLTLAFQFIKTKKLPLILTVFILSIATVLLYSSIIVTKYQSDKVIIDYLNQYNVKLLPLYHEAVYVDSFFDKHEIQLAKGEFFKEIVNQSTTDSVELVKAMYDIEVASESNKDEYRETLDVTSYFVSEWYKGIELSEGKMAINDSEVVVSDYVASVLGLKIGDKIDYDYGTVLEVVGIAKTNYIEYDLKTKLLFGTGGEYTDYYMKYKYNVVYLNEAFINQRMKKEDKRLRLSMADFTLSTRELSLFKSNLYYDDSSKVLPAHLIAGRLPQASNEVVVSSDFAEYRGIYDENVSFLECEYEFLDIYQEKFNNLNSQYMNLKKYFPEGIKIVGIVSNFKSENLCSDVYVFSEVMTKLKNDFYDNYAADLLFSVKSEEYKNIVKLLSDMKIKVNEPSISQIYEFETVLKKISPFMYLLLVLVMILNVCILMNFIQNTIRSNKKNIGILRALGVPMKTTKSIFNIEFRIVFVISALFSFPISSFLIVFANNLYKKGIMENPYNIIGHDLFAFGIALVFGAVIGMAASNVPVRKLNKYKPIELIR